MESAEVYFTTEEAYLDFLSQIPKRSGDVPGPAVIAVFDLMNDDSIDKIQIPKSSRSQQDNKSSSKTSSSKDNDEGLTEPPLLFTGCSI